MTENESSNTGKPNPSRRRISELEREINERRLAEQRREETIRDSEARYRKLFESTGDAIMLLGKAGFLECNEATLRLFGCRTREEFISKHPSELSPPQQPDGTDSRVAADARIAQAYQDGMARFEWMHRRMDGTDVPADVLLARVDLQDRSILQAVVRDISKQKRVEQELREAHEELEQRVRERTAELAAANQDLQREVVERRRAEEDLAFERFLLTTLMEHAPDFIFFKDAQSRFIRISRGLANYYKLNDPTDAIGKSDLEYFDRERAEQYSRVEQEIMRTGQLIVDLEEDQILPDGSAHWQLTNKIPLRSETGDIIGTFGISRDITRLKQTELRLKEAMEQAEAASRAKSDFLANMSHEIRTPMNAIIGLTELVLDTRLSDVQREYLTMVRDSGDSLLTVINDVLDFSKIEAGRLELEEAAFDVREVLGDTMKSLALRAHDKGLELACQIRPDVPECLVGDSGRLRQIVVNLVGNAIKFTDQGEVVLRVESLETKDGRARLQFSVVDTGIGIPHEKRQTVFKAFEQADNSTTRRFGGTGLGLAICSRLVKAMKGDIGVESELGEGSTFHFTIEMGMRSASPASPPRAQRAKVEGTRVLVVDDNATNRRILEEMLTNWRMKPTLVDSARDALTLLQVAHEGGHPYELVLTDANMPDQDGFTLAETVKQDGQLGSTIIMMLTSGGRSGDIGRCEQLGIASYLLKPVKQSELFDAIALALGITAAEDDAEDEGRLDQIRRLGALYILLAEDSYVNQKLAVGLLEKYGHRVDVVTDGRAALAAVQSESYDLVLMDVQMPEMDGLEATQAIRVRERDTEHHIPIVAMTAHAMKGDRERCIDSGMDGYVAKPIRSKELFATMEHVLPEPDDPETENGNASVPANSDDGMVNWAEARESTAGDERLLVEVIEAFQVESAQYLECARTAIETRDAELLHRAAHTLKNNFLTIGVRAMGDIAFSLELLGKEGNFAEATPLLTSLQTDMPQLIAELSAFVANSRGESSG